MNTQHTSFPRRTFLIAGAAGALAAFGAGSRFAFADEISDAQAAITEKQAEADTVYASLQAMQETLDLTSDQYQQALMDQAAAQEAMDAAQAGIDEATAKIGDLQGKLSTRVRGMYRSGSSTFIDVLTGSSSFEEFAVGLDLLNDMSESDARLVQSVKDERQRQEDLRAEYSAQEQMYAQKAAEAEQAKAQAEATVAQYQATYDNLTAEVAELVEKKRQAEEAAAAAAAAAALAAQQAAAAAASSGGSYDGGGSSSGSSGSYVDQNGDTHYYEEPDEYEPSNGSGYYGGGDDAVSRAYACLGAPYVWGAAGPSSFDCSGLVSYALTGSYSHIWTSSSLYQYAAVSDPQPGDVAVKNGHCGIYIGGGQMIHAADYGIGVIIGSVQSGMKIVRP